MKFKPDDRLAAKMTSLVGEVPTTYDRLVEVFGEPHFTAADSGDGKITAEWIIRFEDNMVATIYDYKEKQTPKGQYNWHIGGHDKLVAERVAELVNG